MIPPKRDEPREAAAAAPEVQKKRYQKPDFVKEQLFETMALACGKTNPVIGQCKAVRKSS